MSGRLHYKYNTRRLKARPELVRQCVKEGMIFKSMKDWGNKEYYKYRVKKITKAGRVTVELVHGDFYLKQRSSFCIKLNYGVPYFETKEPDMYWRPDVEDNEGINGQVEYDRDLRKESKNLIGKRFFTLMGSPVVITWIDRRNNIYFNGFTSPARGAYLQFVSPNKPIQIVEDFKITALKQRYGDEYTPATWKRDYSADITILLSCYHYGFPREVAMLLLEFFWKAEETRYSIPMV